jgi:hypothetical protein
VGGKYLNQTPPPSPSPIEGEGKLHDTHACVNHRLRKLWELVVIRHSSPHRGFDAQGVIASPTQAADELHRCARSWHTVGQLHRQVLGIDSQDE